MAYNIREPFNNSKTIIKNYNGNNTFFSVLVLLLLHSFM